MAAASVAVVALACPERAPAQQGGGGEWWDWALPGVAGGQQITVSRGGVILLPAPRKEPERRAPERDDRWGNDRRENDRRGDDRWGYERERVRKPTGKKGGPPFCQNGNGHPVHGWRWCVEKGYGHRERRWERVRWERVTLRRPRQYNSADALRRESLIDILGSVVFGRIETHGRNLVGAAPIVGRWTPTQGYRDGGVLQLRAGNLPIAELTDLDGDGIADVILLLNN